MYLCFATEVLILCAVAHPQGLPFLVQKAPFVSQYSGASTQQISQHDEELWLLVGLVQNLCEFLDYEVATLSGMNISMGMLTTFPAFSSFMSSLSEESLSRLSDSYGLLFFKVFLVLPFSFSLDFLL
jgi:hypothetical protein